MNSKYAIEKNVPFVQERGVARWRKYPFDLMEVGDSVVVPFSGVSAAHAFGKRHDKKFNISKISAAEYRIWRTA